MIFTLIEIVPVEVGFQNGTAKSKHASDKIKYE